MTDHADELSRMRAVCRFIDEHDGGVPSLAAIAAHVGASPWHLQRRFTAVVGLSPRKYAEARRVDRLKARLRAGDDVTGALYDAGYGSSSRLYEKANAHLGMTPASYGKGGAGAFVRHAAGSTPLGLLLVAATERGVCFVALGDAEASLREELRGELPAAEIHPDDGTMAPWLQAVGEVLAGRLPREELPLDVRATAFRWQVWRALAAIPPGETRSYAEIAEMIGKPGAARAVGRACASNPVAVIVPCHRAVRADGGFGGYRWGVDRKRALLAGEDGGGAE